MKVGKLQFDVFRWGFGGVVWWEGGGREVEAHHRPRLCS